MATAEQEMIMHQRKEMAADAWAWAYLSRLELLGSEFKVQGHEYQAGILQEDHPYQVSMKGAQMCLTESAVIKTLHGHIHGRYPSGTLYLFPTNDDVTDFSKARFAPLIVNNPDMIGQYVRDTDAANIKQIGTGMLYLRGARATKKIEGMKRTSSRLKSVPVDRIVFDEFDEMDPDMVTLARERFSHSAMQEQFILSTPSIPDFGIDKEYQSSDQRVWMIPCSKCGKETCLEMEFPDCIVELPRGGALRICIHCRDREINPRDGHWVAQRPSVKEKVGWWISQLNSSYVSAAQILSLWRDPPEGNKAEVYNSKLGQAYIDAENRLTPNDVYACCGRDAMQHDHYGPSAMGVDVGKMLHVVIGHKTAAERKTIHYMGRVTSFNDVHDLAQRHNVKCAVIDMEPETRKAREFQEAEAYAIYLCDYAEKLKVSQRRDEVAGVLVVRRTELCDRTHNLVTTASKLTIPRMCEEVKIYALEMSNMAKVLKEDPVSGAREFSYIKLGPDHYRHATNYFELACDEAVIEVATPPDPMKEIRKRFSKADEYETDYDPFKF